MLSIGEFSRVTQLTVKALRLYHEKGLLIPDQIDLDSRYRYYRSSAIEKALTIKQLKDLGFSLGEIKKILHECRDDQHMVALVEAKLKSIDDSIRLYKEMKQNLSLFLQRAAEDNPGTGDYEALPEIKTEDIPTALVCSIRFKGRYRDVGQYFGVLSRACGRLTLGKPFSLYYDDGYKEDGADIEACVPVRKTVKAEGVQCRKVAGGKAVTVVHRGPYQELGGSYRQLYEYCRKNQLDRRVPIREEYLKGPGMIFRGNPRKYLTKLIIFLIDWKDSLG